MSGKHFRRLDAHWDHERVQERVLPGWKVWSPAFVRSELPEGGTPSGRFRGSALRRVWGIGAGVALAGWIVALSSSGCASKGNPRTGGGALGSGTIDQLHMLVTAAALDMDGKPGPDGFGARVYASSRGSAEAIPIVRGRLEIVMYDGIVKSAERVDAKPLQTWVFEPNKLRALVQKTSIGAGYRFALAWGENKPAQNRVTIIARHRSENGTEVVSAPGIVPLTTN